MAFNIMFGVLFAAVLYGAAFSGEGEKIPSGKWWKSDYDETDDYKNDVRSGLRVFIDYGTGCQYIQPHPFAPITPRLDANGKIICVNTNRGD